MPSTLIRGARYWPDERALELCFAEGRRYLYLGVPRSVADGLRSAPSMGSYFNRSIKGHYPCHELARDSAEPRRRAAND